MRTDKVGYFTEKEEEFAQLLTDTGTKKNVAKVLVFLAGTPETTSHAIEHGTDLRQPEVSLAMRYLRKEGWITSYENRDEKIGRPVKIYRLVKPITEVLDSIERKKEEEAQHRLRLIRKLQDYVR